jgi:hypothetical protein
MARDKGADTDHDVHNDRKDRDAHGDHDGNLVLEGNGKVVADELAGRPNRPESSQNYQKVPLPQSDETH